MRLTQRAALRAAGLMGSASGVNLLIGLARMKIVALLVGAPGVGLIGIYQNFMTAAAALGGLGIATAAPREIAALKETRGEAGETVARRAVMLGSVVLALLTAAIIFLFREPIASLVLGNEAEAAIIGWLGAGVGLSIVYAGQSGTLSGLQRIADLAKVTLLGAVLGTVAGLLAVWLMRENGLLLYVIAAPAAAALVGGLLMLRLRQANAATTGIDVLAPVWRDLVTLGAATMAGSFVAASGPLFIRIAIGDRLGLHELGLFQASWSLAAVYLGIVLQAMSADYFPRLTRDIGDPIATAKAVNAQTEFALLIGGPIILLIMGAAPLILHLLYASEFQAAAAMLRWQMLGDVLKLLSWPLGFVLLASRRGGAFLAVETIATVMFVLATWLLLERLGFVAAGIGYALMYAVYLPVLFILCRRQMGFRWSKTVVIDAITLLAAAILVMFAAISNSWLGLALGPIAATGFGLRALTRLRATND